MESAAPEQCQSCFRPKAEAGAPPQMQWVSVCRCDRPYSPNAQFSIEVCANCRRRVPVHATQQSTRIDLCSCSQPAAKKIATQIKQSETDPVSFDPKTVGLSADSFPSERFAPIAFLGDTPRATVLLCRDRMRGTKVAVKCFKNIAPALYPTFDSEVRKNKQLSHTSIAKIVDAGVHNDKTPYVVTEYKDGFSLEQCVAIYGYPSYDVAVRILLTACEALSYAQKQGVLHGDIRPGNIIFLDDMNSEPSIAITDFAFPKVKAKEELSNSWFTLYMSADEARNLDYSEQSEVYSLGCIGYFLLTARAPFIDGSALDMKNMHALKLPPRIVSLNFQPSRPKDLEEVIEKCLEKDPRDRFETIAKFQERLEVFPRRIQMRIDAVLAARKRAKLMRIGAIALAVAAVCAAGFFAIGHH